MENNLPVKSKNVFWHRIVNRIRGFFRKEKPKIDVPVEEIKETEVPGNTSFIEKYQVEEAKKLTENVIKENIRRNNIEDIIKIIEERPELLDELDIDKLRIIDNYYTEKIEEYKKKLANYNV